MHGCRAKQKTCPCSVSDYVMRARIRSSGATYTHTCWAIHSTLQIAGYLSLFSQKAFSANGDKRAEGYNCLCSDGATPVQLGSCLYIDSIYCIYLSVLLELFCVFFMLTLVNTRDNSLINDDKTELGMLLRAVWSYRFNHFALTKWGRNKD